MSDTIIGNLRRGRAQRLLSAATAASALPLGVEIYINHYGGSNLFICDGSVLPTQGSTNPALTIMALASRLADRLASGASAASGS